MMNFFKKIWDNLIIKWLNFENKYTQKNYGLSLKKSLEELFGDIIVQEIFNIEFIIANKEEFELLKEKLKTGIYKEPFKEKNNTDNYSYMGTLCQVKSSDNKYYAVFQDYLDDKMSLLLLELQGELNFDKTKSNYYHFEGNKMIDYRVIENKIEL